MSTTYLDKLKRDGHDTNELKLTLKAIHRSTVLHGEIMSEMSSCKEIKGFLEKAHGVAKRRLTTLSIYGKIAVQIAEILTGHLAALETHYARRKRTYIQKPKQKRPTKGLYGPFITALVNQLRNQNKKNRMKAPLTEAYGQAERLLEENGIKLSVDSIQRHHAKWQKIANETKELGGS